MHSIPRSLWSSVGKKFIMGLTGLLWICFASVHLIGNSMLYSGDPDHFNKYAHFLMSTGELLYVFEAALVLLLTLHIISGLSVWLKNRQARPVGYTKSGNAGGNSRKTISSITMIYTGIVLFVFLFIHIWTFKYGAYYEITVDGTTMRDLYRLVYESFADPIYTFWYVFAMVLLFSHFRHGFWSAFQSLGVSHPRYSPFISSVGILVAVVLGLGFIAIPLYIFFTGGAL